MSNKPKKKPAVTDIQKSSDTKTIPKPIKESKKRKRSSTKNQDPKTNNEDGKLPVFVDFNVDPAPISLSEVDDILQSYADVSKISNSKDTEQTKVTSSDESVHKKKKQRLSKDTNKKKKESATSSTNATEHQTELLEYPILHDKTQLKATEITKTRKDPNKLQSIDQSTNSVLQKIVPVLIKLDPPVNTDTPNPKPSSLFIKKQKKPAPVFSDGDNDDDVASILSGNTNYNGRSYLAGSGITQSGTQKTTIIFDDDCEREKETHIRVFDNMSPPQQQTLTAKIQASVADKLPFANITSTDMKKQTNFHMDSMIGKWQEISEKLFSKKTQHTKNNTTSRNSNNSVSSSNSSINQDGRQHHDTYRPDIPLISREYIKSFLREPLVQLGERPCMLGNNCISMDLCTMRSREPFQLREFLLPNELSLIADKARNEPTKDILDIVKLVIEEQKPCILCSRYFIHRCAASNGSLGGGPITLIQNHGNRFNSDGEYTEDAMLVCGQTFSGIVVPIVRFDMTDYVPIQYDVFYRKAIETPGVISKLTVAKNSSGKYQFGGTSKTTNTSNSSRSYESHTSTQKQQESKHMDLDTYNRVSLDLDRSDETIQAKLRNSQRQAQKEDVDIYTIDARGWGESSKIIYDAKNRDINMENTTLLTERLNK